MNFFKTTLLSLAGVGISASLSAQTVIPNASFETWQADTIQDFIGNDIIYQAPQDWTPVIGLFSVLFGGAGVNLQKDNSAQAGSSAVRLFIGTDSIGCDLVTGIPVVGTIPTKLTGYYKYNGLATDTAIVITTLSRYNVAADSAEELGGGSYVFAPKTSYTKFEVPITQTISGTPDTTVIYFNYLAGAQNSALVFDNLSFETASGIWHLSKSADISLYPNPTTDEISLKLDKTNLPQTVSISLYDIQGRLLQSAETAAADLRMDISALPSNTYSLRIQHGNDFWVEKIVKQ